MKILITTACSFVVTVAAIVTFITPLVSAQETKQSDGEAMYHRCMDFESYIKGGSIRAHWMADGSSFWYAEGAPENTIIWKVNPKGNTKTLFFDTPRLREALSRLLGHQQPRQGLPFAEFTFVDDGENTIKFTIEDKAFILQLDTYIVTPAPVLSYEEKVRLAPQVVRKGAYGGSDLMELPSPDGKWLATVRDHNLWLRSKLDGHATQITSDGIQDFGWELSGARWSPISSKLTIRKVDARKNRKVPVVHWLKSVVDVEWFPSLASPAQEDELLPPVELYVVDIPSHRKVRIDTGKETDNFISITGWLPDGSEVLFRRVNRVMNKVEVLAADPATGSARLILTETSKNLHRRNGAGLATAFYPSVRREKVHLDVGTRRLAAPLPV